MKRDTTNNRGFSMVELIVVIAIMAILAGALAPVLIRYVNKARLSTDIDTGKEIAKAMMTALTEEDIRDNAVVHDTTPQAVEDMDGNDFKKEVYDILGQSTIKGKSKKDADGAKMENGSPQFYYTLDADKNQVAVYYGGTDADHQIHPVVGKKLLK